MCSKIPLRIREQVNILAIFTTVFFAAVCYGWIEGEIYPSYVSAGETLAIFGHFSYYHVVFLSLFIVIAFTVSISKVMTNLKKGYILAACLGSFIWAFWIEDMTYFAWRFPYEILGRCSWVNWNLSGLYVFGYWVPTVYFLMSGLGFILFAAAFIRSHRFARREYGTRATFDDKLDDFKNYIKSILPFLLVIWPVCILAASLTKAPIFYCNPDVLTKDSIFNCNLARIICISLIVYFTTIAAMFCADKLYATFKKNI